MFRCITIVPPKELVTRGIEIDAAIKRADGREHLNNSFTKGKSSPHGKVGELLVPWYYKNIVMRQSVGRDIYQWDWFAPLVNRLEVKTKVCTSDPQPHYLASVADAHHTQTLQDCDWYCFLRIRKDYSRAYILGFLPKDLFVEQSEYYYEGEMDPSSNGMFPFKENCWNVRADELIPPPFETAVCFSELLQQEETLRQQLFLLRHTRQYGSIFDVVSTLEEEHVCKSG